MFTEPHSIRDDCVYRAAPEETDSSILQGGQSKASAGPEAWWGTARKSRLRTTPYASNFEIARLRHPPQAGIVADTDFARLSNAMTVVDPPIPSD
jgi:hypothetical protein